MSVYSKLSSAKRFMTDPDFRFSVLACHGYIKKMPSEEFVKRIYRFKMGRPLNLEAPQYYTEKLQWLKLYDHRDVYTEMVDKLAAKKYVADRIGQQYVVPLLGQWDSVDEIDFENLPTQFVLKATHDSGGYLICRDKNKLNISAAKRKLRYLMRRNYYICSREWPYKNVKPRIIAEQFMEDSRLKELRDYKFFTFGGVPKVLYIAQGRRNGVKTVADFFDMDFNHLPFTIDHDMAAIPPEKPVNFELMKELAAKLSAGTPQLRVDFYEVDGHVYFGEMTFFHCSGTEAFHPEHWDLIFGDWLVLPPENTEESL